MSTPGGTGRSRSPVGTARASSTTSAVVALRELLVAAEAYRLAAARFFELGIAETHALTHLDLGGPMAQVELADRMGLTSGGATGLVDRMEQAGLAERVADPDDRRRHSVRLTELGESVLRRSQERLSTAVAEAAGDEAEALADGLRRLSAALLHQAEELAEDLRG